MALSVSTQANPVGTKLVVQTVATSTADNNVTGAAAVVYMIQVDNSLNGGSSYLKLYDNNSPTVGTTDPDLVIMALGNRDFVVAIPEGISFGTGLSLACVTAGGTGGTNGPGNAVTVRLVTS